MKKFYHLAFQLVVYSFRHYQFAPGRMLFTFNPLRQGLTEGRNGAQVLDVKA